MRYFSFCVHILRVDENSVDYFVECQMRSIKSWPDDKHTVIKNNIHYPEWYKHVANEAVVEIIEDKKIDYISTDNEEFWVE